MIDVEADEAEIQKALGATVVHLDLDTLLKSAEAASPKEASRAAGSLLRAARGEREIDEQRLAENLRLYVGLKETIRQNTLDAYCVRCWPELRDQRKITPCAAHALLAEEGVPNTCEVDLPALIATWILSRMADAPAFNFDITAYLEEEGAIQLAHCGAAAPSLEGDPESASIRAHMRTGTGATVEFPFKPGAVTLAKLLRPNNGKLTLAAAGGASRLADARSGRTPHRAGLWFLAERSGDVLRIRGDPVHHAAALKRLTIHIKADSHERTLLGHSRQKSRRNLDVRFCQNRSKESVQSSNFLCRLFSTAHPKV
jgi:L-fucose isomerase-like protein